MNKQQINDAIEETRQEIYRLKEQLEKIHDPQMQNKIMRELKELQIRQIWYLDQLDAW